MTNLTNIVFTPNLAKHVFKMKKSAIDLLHNIGFWEKKVTLEDLVDNYSGTIFEKIKSNIKKLEAVADTVYPTIKMKTTSGKDNAVVKVTTVVFIGETIKVISHTSSGGKVTASESEWCSSTGSIIRSCVKDVLTGITEHQRVDGTGQLNKSRISGAGELLALQTVHTSEQFSLNGLRKTTVKRTVSSSKKSKAQESFHHTYQTTMPDGNLIVDDENSLSVLNSGGILLSKTSKELQIENELVEIHGKKYISASRTTDHKGEARSIYYTYYHDTVGNVTMVDVCDTQTTLRLFSWNDPSASEIISQ